MKSYVTNLYPKPNGTNADERLTVGATVTAFTTTFATSTDAVVLDVQSADVMVTFDGSDPSSSNGHFLANGTSYTWSKAAAVAARFIRFGLTSAAIQASQFTT